MWSKWPDLDDAYIAKMEDVLACIRAALLMPASR